MRLVRPALAVSAAVLCHPATAATLVPDRVLPSTLTVRLLDPVTVVPPSTANHVASPVAINDTLYVIDQRRAEITLLDGTPILGPDTLPAGVEPEARLGVMNIAGRGDRAYVAFSSSVLPDGFAGAAPLPTDAAYDERPTQYDLIYRYEVAPDGSLASPVPVTAFESQRFGHRGEGMLVLPDGSLLFARGDQLLPTYNGLKAPQDPGSTVGKLLRIDGETGATEVLAGGLRNVQHLAYDTGQDSIVFADIGWRVAEEINRIAVSDLVDTTRIENFGWGVAEDGLAREGSFYINDGPEPVAAAIGEAPVGEAGFVQPFAQFGRDDIEGFFAASGPVASAVSFDRIGLLFGDISNGGLYATLSGAEGILNDVFAVNVLSEDGGLTDLPGLLGGGRDDMRFFNFPDLSAGILFERSGQLFRVAEVAYAPVPVAASLPLLASGLAAFALLRRRSRPRA